MLVISVVTYTIYRFHAGKLSVLGYRRETPEYVARRRVANTLLKEFQNTRLTRLDCEQALGVPTRTNAKPSQWSLMWYLGEKPGVLFPWKTFFVVGIGETGELVNAQIIDLD